MPTAEATTAETTFCVQRKSLVFIKAFPSWFSVDHKLGCLTVHLEQPACFRAWDLADPTIIEDTRYNLGAVLLQVGCIDCSVCESCNCAVRASMRVNTSADSPPPTGLVSRVPRVPGT